MERYVDKLALSVAGILIAFCCSCTTTEQVTAEKADGLKAVEAKPVPTQSADLTVAEMGPPAPKPPATKPEPASVPDARDPETKPARADKEPGKEPVDEEDQKQVSIVAEIGDYDITSEELRKKLIRLNHGGHNEAALSIERVDAMTALRNLIAEKAVIIQGRQEGLLEHEDAISVKERCEEHLGRLLVQRHVAGKVKVTEAEIEAKVKADPKMDRNRAKMMLQRQKAGRLTEQFYDQLCEKLNVKKLRYNLPKAAEIHQRLLRRPQNPRKQWWITWDQMTKEMTEEEKNLELATFDGGKVTLIRWFRILHKMPPLKRPKDLDTIQGVERLLDRALNSQVFVVEARLQGLDKNEDYKTKTEEQERRHLVGRFREKAFEGLENPTKPQMREYFEQHKEQFRRPDTMKIDVVWCQDLETAKKVKAQLDDGNDFGVVREQYSLKKNEQPFETTPAKEGVFFEDLWKAEPGEIVGPVKGFFPKRGNRRVELQVKWRIVKIVEKKAGKLREYSSGVERDVRREIIRQRREVVMSEHRKKLLAKYAYKIYSEKLKDADPFDIR
ncbi:MAG: peptidylprolyl isomerase [Planctomycetota bacterium]|jgi:hypothetical protein